jgi:hypothetical protein
MTRLLASIADEEDVFLEENDSFFLLYSGARKMIIEFIKISLPG